MFKKVPAGLSFDCKVVFVRQQFFETLLICVVVFTKKPERLKKRTDEVAEEFTQIIENIPKILICRISQAC